LAAAFSVTSPGRIVVAIRREWPQEVTSKAHSPASSSSEITLVIGFLRKYAWFPV
jgi:hypothetical protein